MKCETCIHFHTETENYILDGFCLNGKVRNNIAVLLYSTSSPRVSKEFGCCFYEKGLKEVSGKEYKRCKNCED